MAAKKVSTKKPVTDSEDQDTDTQEGTEDTDSQEADPEDENKRINAIVTSRVKREMKAVNQQLVALQELIKGLSPVKKSEDDADEETDSEDTQVSKKAEVDPKLSKKFTRLEKELAEQKARADKAEREKAEESERTRRQEMRNTFQSALSEYGVTDPLLIEAALDRLEKTGQMFRDEDGKVKFKGQDKYGIETNFDPKVGLKTWVQTEGKSYVPAVDAGGSGTGASRSGQSGSRDGSMTKGQYNKLSDYEKAAMELERASQGLPQLDA